MDTFSGTIYYTNELNETGCRWVGSKENCSYELKDYFPEIEIKEHLLDNLLIKADFNKLINAGFIKDNLLLVSHHHRLKELFTFSLSDKSNLAIANCSCIMIEQDGDNYNYKYTVLSSGYPDKSNSCEKKQEGGGEYCYLSENDNGNVIINNESLKNYLYEWTDRKIYIVRHGNALHNKPCDPGDLLKLNRIKDSPLTPLGMYQAELLGQKITNAGFKDAMNYITGAPLQPLQPLQQAITDNKITIITSELKRAQHTTLTILNEILTNVDITYVKKMYDIKATKAYDLNCKNTEQIKELKVKLQINIPQQEAGYKKKLKKRRQSKKHRKSSKRKLLKRKRSKRSKRYKRSKKVRKL